MNVSDFPPFMNMATCARFIDRTPGAVKKMVFRGQIPYRRKGRRISFNREAIAKWMLNDRW